MSNALAIAAVTATLSRLLSESLKSELGGGGVTTRPPDKVRSGDDKNSQINLFLYHIVHDAAWRNMDMPRQARPGEQAYPPLALTLYYMLTAYGKNDDQSDPNSHRLLGVAMSALHDHPLLGATEIKNALKDSDLADQIERVRITPQPLSLEELSKLWTTFQSQYRISVAYQVSVVLIESQREAKAALPVLQRGPNDQGYDSLAGTSPPFPMLTSITPPAGRPAALLGDTLTLVGSRLDDKDKPTDTTSVSVRFSHPRLAVPIDIVIPNPTPTQLTVQIPANQPANWPAGLYSVSVVIQHTNDPNKLTRVSNELPLALAPKITTALPAEFKLDKNKATIDLQCAPDARPGQPIFLLLDDRTIAGQIRDKDQPSKLRFVVENATAGLFFARLRVDGVDSMIVTDYQARPPMFDTNQKLRLKT